MTRFGPHRLLTSVLAAALVCGSVSGCSLIANDPPDLAAQSDAPFGDVEEAVAGAIPRGVTVRDLSRSQNGFGDRLSLGLVSESPEPFTAQELDTVIETIWRTLPWEPNAIKMTAGAVASDGEDVIVDLRAAADQLDPLGVTGAGQSGATVTRMDARYGEWAPPE